MTDHSIARADYVQNNPAEPVPEIKALIRPDGDGVVFVARDGWKMYHVAGALEHARQHCFDDIHSFCDWLNRHGEPLSTEILIDTDEILGAIAPRTMRAEILCCKLLKDPVFELWERATIKALDISDFQRLVRAAGETSLEMPVREMLLGALRDFSVTRGSKTEVRVDDSGYVTYAAASNDRNVSGKLPAQFNIRTPIFDSVWIPAATDDGESRADELERATYEMEVYLTLVDLPGNAVGFSVDIPKLDIAIRSARRDVARMCGAMLNPDFLVGLGSLCLEERKAFRLHGGDFDLRSVVASAEVASEGEL